MATRTPSPMTPGTTPPADAAFERTDESSLDSTRHVQRLLDIAAELPTPTTASRALRPPVVVRHKRLARHGVGEAFLVWRCLDCGTVGALDSLPRACACGASRESLAYVTED